MIGRYAAVTSRRVEQPGGVSELHMDLSADDTARPLRAGVLARRASSSLAAAITIGLLASACGTSAPTRGSTQRTVAALAFAKCMRGHGVPDFPDPGASISVPYNSVGSIEIPASIDTQSPAFQAGQNACHGYLSAALSPRGKPTLSASLRASLIAHAQCMRTRGVPNIQDPRFPSGGGIATTDAGTNPQSPAYQHAQSVCARR
jgi:hypothetical protein